MEDEHRRSLVAARSELARLGVETPACPEADRIRRAGAWLAGHGRDLAAHGKCAVAGEYLRAARDFSRVADQVEAGEVSTDPEHIRGALRGFYRGMSPAKQAAAVDAAVRSTP